MITLSGPSAAAAEEEEEEEETLEPRRWSLEAAGGPVVSPVAVVLSFVGSGNDVVSCSSRERSSVIAGERAVNIAAMLRTSS